MKTHKLAIVDPNHTVVVPHNIKVTVTKTNAIALTTHLFEDDRQLTADDCIQKEKPVSTKNRKRIIFHGYI